MKGIAIRSAGKDYGHGIPRLRAVGRLGESSWKGCGKPGSHAVGVPIARLSASLIGIFSLILQVQQDGRLPIAKESQRIHIIDT